jgi:tRNA pseudouridine38-40 synthase
MEPRCYRLVLEYDGAGFEGWQVQAGDRRTVQGALEAAIAQVTGQTVRVTGSGRTDTGVHAEGQVASVALAAGPEPAALQQALNGVLERDVVVRELALAPAGFDARRDATAKRYRYALWNASWRAPLRAARTLHVPYALDLGALRAGLQGLVGTHDFASFQGAGASVTTTTRKLLAAELSGEAGGALQLEFEGSGFLRHMVRNLVGTLLEVGAGKRAPESLESLLAARDRRRAGPTAPAHALTLLFVRYPASVSEAASSPMGDRPD